MIAQHYFFHDSILCCCCQDLMKGSSCTSENSVPTPEAYSLCSRLSIRVLLYGSLESRTCAWRGEIPCCDSMYILSHDYQLMKFSQVDKYADLSRNMSIETYFQMPGFYILHTRGYRFGQASSWPKSRMLVFRLKKLGVLLRNSSSAPSFMFSYMVTCFCPPHLVSVFQELLLPCIWSAEEFKSNKLQWMYISEQFKSMQWGLVTQSVRDRHGWLDTVAFQNDSQLMSHRWQCESWIHTMHSTTHTKYP